MIFNGREKEIKGGNMVGETIIRTQTMSEKKDFIEIGKTPLDIVFDKIAKKQQEFQRKEEPFCSRCARLDVEEKIHRLKEKAENKIFGRFEKAEEVEDLDFDAYGESKRFEVLDTSPVREVKLIDGIRKEFETGSWENFRCKERGCGLSVFVEKKEDKK